MAATVIPMPKFMAFSDAGAPLSAGLVYTYAAGTTTPLATYSDSDLTTPNANPVVLDSAGRATIYLTASSYKIVLKNSAGATVYTQDNIIAAAPYNVDLDVPITAGEVLTAGQAIYLSDGTGSRTAGRWYLTDSDTAAYSTLPITGFVTTALALGEEGSVRLLGQATVPGPVSVGLTYYLSGTPGALSTTAGTFVKNMGTADSTTTLIMTVATPVTPGGSNTQVQFNDSGVLGGDSGFTFIKATDAVAIVGPLTVGGTLGVTGATTLSSTVATGALTVTGAATVSTTLGVTGATTLSSTLAVTGVTTLTGGLNTPLVPAQGGTGLSSYAVGDLVYASGSTTLAKLADVAVGQVLVSGGVATAPAYSASPSITALTYTTNLKSTTALATPTALTATQATEFASTVSGASLMGFGTTNDVALMNRAGTVVLGVGPNTTAVNMTGALGVSGLLTVSGFGTHSFNASGTGANRVYIQNTSAGAGNYAALFLDNNTGGVYGQFIAFSSNYTTSGLAIANGVQLSGAGPGGLSIGATDASGTIRFYSMGTTLSGGFPGQNMFHVSASATYPTGTTNAFYVDNTSNVNVAFSHTTTANQGWINLLNSNGSIGSVTGSGSTTSFNTSSDRRLKNDLGLASDISALRSVEIHEFAWKVDGAIARGVFAQDAFLVFPSAVFVGTDELDPRGNLKQPWSVDYSKFVPDLIVGWQQHDATIQSLTARIAALEAGV